MSQVPSEGLPLSSKDIQSLTAKELGFPLLDCVRNNNLSGQTPFPEGLILGKLCEGSSCYKDVSCQHLISLALLVIYCRATFLCKFCEDMLLFWVPPSVSPSHL